MFKAAIFDVFGTVVDWRSGVAAAAQQAFPDAAQVDAGAFADAWRAEYDPAMARVREGGRSYVRLDTLHRENLDRVLAAFGLEDSLSEEEKTDLNRAWERLPPWPDSVPGLTTLKKTMPIAPCSNGSIALMTHLARYSGLPWDCILGAEIGQGYKPDPRVYLASCAALNLAPAEVVMVAAHNADLAAARAAGLGAAFIPRPREKGPAGGETEPTEDWEVVAKDIEDLARILSDG